MNIVKAFERYCIDEDYVSLSGAEEIALEAFVVWLVQNGLLSTLEVGHDETDHAQSMRRAQGSAFQ